jgi:hypothetical protein
MEKIQFCSHIVRILFAYCSHGVRTLFAWLYEETTVNVS